MKSSIEPVQNAISLQTAYCSTLLINIEEPAIIKPEIIREPQIKTGEFVHLSNKLNEHLDAHKKKGTYNKYTNE